MKLIPGIFFMAAILAGGFGCDDVINGLETYQRLGVEKTAQGLADLISMDLNSESGAFAITFDSGGVSLSGGATSGCMILNGEGYYPYGLYATSWNATFTVSFANCQGNSGSSYNGVITVSLAGPLGSVSSYGFSGNIEAIGPVRGRLAIDVDYTITYSCLANWDCWSGAVNGYSVSRLWEAYSN